MPNIYYMNASKSLVCSKTSKNFVGENNAESIFILLPQSYNGCDIRQASVSIEFVEQKKNVSLQPSPDLYNKFLVYSIPLDKSLTKQVEVIQFRVNIKGTNLNISTSQCFLNIINP